MVFFIGCLHIGHENMAKHRGFESSEQHDTLLAKVWNRTVGKRDKVFILGDVTMEKSAPYPFLEKLNGFKSVVLGNHDRPQDVYELMQYVEHVSGALLYKGYMLTHVPIHPNEVLGYRGNIHAHIHHINKLQEFEACNKYADADSVILPTVDRYYNADAHLLGFKPRTLVELTGKE